MNSVVWSPGAGCVVDSARGQRHDSYGLILIMINSDLFIVVITGY